MSKLKGSSTSKRLTSRHKKKVDRKKKENKRDLKKAAKAMRASGLRIRPKMQREKAKLALKLSSKDPNKERVLNGLLRSRERIKMTKLQRKKARAEEAAGAVAAEGDKKEEDDGRQDAPWMHPISAGQLEQRERAARREGHEARAAEERQRGVRRYLAFPAGQAGSGDPAVQLRKIISVMRHEVPVFIFTLDARCALESMPWAVLDDLIATAVAEDSNADADKNNTTPVVEGAKARHVFFVLTRADLISADVLVRGAVAVAQAVKERYLDTEPAVERLISFSCLAAAPHASSQSIMYLIKALNQKIAEIVAVRKQLNALVAGPDGSDPVFPKKDLNKIVFCVFGYPNTGRTSLCAAIAKRASESACRIIFPGNISEVVHTTKTPATAEGAAASEATRRRFRFDEAKPITLLCVGESSALQAAPVVAGDILFHRHATPERMNDPENPAIRFLDALPRQPDFESICRAFGQPGCTDGRHFITCLGRCVRREHGFYTPHSDDAIVSSSIGQGLFASSIDGVSQPTLKVFHQVSAQKRDGSHATRIGARVFLHELCRGEWGLRWSTNAVPEAVRNSSQGISACLGAVFETPPTALRRGRGGAGADDDEEEADGSSVPELSAAEKRSRSLVERGIANVISLQNIAQTMPLAEALSASRGLSLPSKLFTPQVDMNLADTEHVFNEDEEDDEDKAEEEGGDDGSIDLDEGFGDFDSDYERMLMEEDEEGDFDDSDDELDSDASSGGMFSDPKAAKSAWQEARKETQKQSSSAAAAAALTPAEKKKQQLLKQQQAEDSDDDISFDDEEEEEETDFGFVTGGGNFFKKGEGQDSEDFFDSDEEDKKA